MARLIKANLSNITSNIPTKTYNYNAIGSTIQAIVNAINNVNIDYSNINYDTFVQSIEGIHNYITGGNNISQFNYDLTQDAGNTGATPSGSTPTPTKGTYLSGKGAANGYGPAFLDKVKTVAAKHNMDYKELLGLMTSESGLNAHCDNGVGYVGFMQMGDDACRNCGTTRSAVKNMTPIEQMDIVDKHLTNLEKSMPAGSHKASDYYAANFLPARAKNEVLTTSDENYYKWNSGLDRNKDGKITKTELDERIKSNYVDESCFTA